MIVYGTCLNNIAGNPLHTLATPSRRIIKLMASIEPFPAYSESLTIRIRNASIGESIKEAAVPDTNPHKIRQITWELRPGNERSAAIVARSRFVTGFETSYIPNFTPPSSK